jgi:hypothetical protein
MTDKVNGNYQAGSFLSGQPQWWAFATLVPVAQTNVDTPVVDLPGYQVYATLGTWTNVTVVNGAGTAITYSTLNSYLDAFYQQQNYNILTNNFAGRGNPVQVGISTLPASINGADVNPHSSTYFAQAGYYNNITGAVTSVFGSSYNATQTYTVTIVTVSTEKNNIWENYGVNNYGNTTADNTNQNGYLALSNNTLYGGLDGLACFDNQSSQVLSGSSNSSAAAVNSTFATTNTVAPYVNSFNASSASLTNTMAALVGNLPGGLI